MTLSGMDNLLMPVFMFLLMLGMGATLTTNHFRQVTRHPLPVLIGLASQYGWMPLIAVSLALLLDLSPLTAIGLLTSMAWIWSRLMPWSLAKFLASGRKAPV